MKDLKVNERLFIVDLETVSVYSKDNLDYLLQNDEKYLRTPFLFLISSLVRNQAISWADDNLIYKSKEKLGSWVVYCFQKI